MSHQRKKLIKNLLVFFSIFLLGGIKMHALEKVCFAVGASYVDPMPSGSGSSRTPVTTPNVSLDGHTLYFNNVGYDLTLVLLDDEENEVYSTLVPAGAMAVMLPSSLNGTYELQLYPGGNYYFFSDITL